MRIRLKTGVAMRKMTTTMTMILLLEISTQLARTSQQITQHSTRAGRQLLEVARSHLMQLLVAVHLLP